MVRDAGDVGRLPFGPLALESDVGRAAAGPRGPDGLCRVSRGRLGVRVVPALEGRRSAIRVPANRTPRLRRAAFAWVVAVGLLGAAEVSTRADEPPANQETTDSHAPSNQSASANGASSASAPAEKGEFNFFPIVGGDSDVGIGVGEVSNWARVNPATKKFSRRLENAFFITFKERDGSLIVPFLDVYLLLTLPHIGPGGRFRVDVRPSYTDERTLGYEGIGNASQRPAGFSDAQLSYRRTHPTLAVDVRARLWGHLYAKTSSAFTYSWLDVPPDSFLVHDRETANAEVRRLLGGWDPHGIWLLGGGFEYDSRDNETVTTRGQFHSASVRGSPAFGGWAPYGYAQANVTLRFYTQPVPRWLSISWRLVGDAFLGDPPFYELARFDDTPAIGGGKALRGVPAQRYHGKVKAFGNLEARSELWPFTIKGKPLVLGVATFFDAGRTWTELFRREPDLDGTGLGLKYGIGAGLRLQEGDTFVVRADLAWSPDARPLGGYFAAGQIF